MVNLIVREERLDGTESKKLRDESAETESDGRRVLLSDETADEGTIAEVITCGAATDSVSD